LVNAVLLTLFLIIAAIVGAASYFPIVLREAIMLIAAALSYFATKKESHEANGFSFAPIIEVAVLFIGIFVTIQPALEYLRVVGPSMGLTTPRDFFFVTGARSRTPAMSSSAPPRAGAVPDRDQPRRRPLGSEHLRRQRPQLHGQSDLRPSELQDAELFRIHGLVRADLGTGLDRDRSDLLLTH
jgi:hypothetical protein